MRTEKAASIEELKSENNKLQDIINEQKERLDDILSSKNEVIWSRRATDLSLSYINDACLKIYGYTPSELLANGGILFDHIHPEDKAKLDEQVKKVIKKGSGELEYRIIHRNGSVRHIFGQAHVKYNADGHPMSFNGTSIDITKLRSTENDLRNKVKEIENIFESITDSFISIDKNWNILYVNKQFEQLLKKNRNELIGNNFWRCFPALNASPLRDNYYRCMDERVHVHSEGVSPSTGRLLSVNFYPTDSGIAIYFDDITEERLLQDKIQNNEKSLRAIINNTKDIIWSMDTGMNLISANQAYYDRIAYLTKNKSFDDITIDDYGQERVDKWNSYFNRAFNGEVFKVIEEDITIGDRKVFEEISFNPIHDKDNKIVGVSCFSRDITEQKLLQDKVAKDEQNLRALINNTNDSIWSVDKDLKIILINEASKRFVYSMTGNIAEQGSYALWPGLPTDFLEERKKHYMRALNGETFTVFNQAEFDGKTICAETSFNPIRDSNGDILGVSCISRDVSDHRKQIEKIRKQNEKLTEIARIQSHEVRGPVANLLGLVQIFNTEDYSDPVNKDIIDGIKTAALSLDNIIHEVVKKTKIN
jgi:PAS domain S-box-containing protein